MAWAPSSPFPRPVYQTVSVQWLSHSCSLSHHTPLPHRREPFPARIPVNPLEAPLGGLFCSPPTHTTHCSQMYLPQTRSSYATCYLTPGVDAHLLERSTADVPVGGQGLRHPAVGLTLPLPRSSTPPPLPRLTPGGQAPARSLRSALCSLGSRP